MATTPYAALLPGRLDLAGETGYELAVYITIDPGVTITAPAVKVVDRAGATISAGTPDTVSVAGQVITVIWSAAKMAALNALGTAFRWHLEGLVNGAGPRPLFAGWLSVLPVGSVGAATTNTVNATVTVGGVNVAATVAVGGSTLDGIMAVDGDLITLAGGVPTRTTRTALAADPAFAGFALRASNLSDLASAAAARTNLGVIGPQPTPRIAGRYYRFPNGPLSTTTPSNGDLRFAPAWIWESCTLDRIGAEVTAGVASSLVRLGVYADDGFFRPNITAGPLLDAGTIDGNSATVQEIVCSLALTRGWYWFAAAFYGGASAPTVRSVSSPYGLGETGNHQEYGTSAPSVGLFVSGYRLTGISGALPSSGTLTLSGATIGIFGRLS